MIRKIYLSIVLLVCASVFTSPALADICEENINSVCIGCHNPDRVCENIGASEKTWEELMEFMVANGLELEQDEIEAMIKCLSEPSAGAKEACGK